MPKELGQGEFAARMRAMISKLGMSLDNGPRGGDAARAFSPHSFRSFIPSVHNALGYDQSELAWLPAWNPSQAATYVRTGKSSSLEIQQKVAEKLRELSTSNDEIGESDVMEGIAQEIWPRGRVLESLR